MVQEAARHPDLNPSYHSFSSRGTILLKPCSLHVLSTLKPEKPIPRNLNICECCVFWLTLMNNFTGQVASSPLAFEDHRASFLKSFCYSSIRYKDLSLIFVTYSFHYMLCVRYNSLQFFSLLAQLVVFFSCLLQFILSNILQSRHKIISSSMSEEHVEETRITEHLRIGGNSWRQTCLPKTESATEGIPRLTPVGF